MKMNVAKVVLAAAVCCGLFYSSLAEERHDGDGRRRHEGREEGRRGRRNGRERREGGDSSRQAWQMAEHKTFLDVRYAEKCEELPPNDPDQDRTLDIHIPNTAQPTNGWPVVVFIHGGGFSNGSKAAVRA